MAPMASLSLEELRRLTDPEAAAQALAQLTADEMRADDALEVVLADDTAVDSVLESLDALKPRVTSLLGQANALAAAIAKTNVLAERTSAKVRQLDVLQSRVQQTLRQLDDIIEVQNCAKSLQEAMGRSDYEAAAINVQRYLKFNPSLLELAFEDAAEEREALQSAVADFGAAVEAAFVRATKENDDDGIVRFFKLFPLINRAEQGLTLYGDYLANLLATRIGAALEGLRMPAGPKAAAALAPHVALLTQLFEQLANVIDHQEPLVETHYSPGRMLTLIERLQRECDALVARIVAAYATAAQLSQQVQSMAAPTAGTSAVTSALPAPLAAAFLGSSATPTPASPATDGPALRDIDRTLHDLAGFARTVLLYERFLHDRLQAQLEIASAAGESGTAAQRRLVKVGVDGWLKATGLRRQLRELMAQQYVTLEDGFLRRSIERAHQVDTREPGALTSSSLDDAFFILKKCILRGIGTTDVETMCTVVNLAAQAIDRDYVEPLRRRLQRGYDPRDATGAFLVAANNLDLAAEYTARLRQEVAEAWHAQAAIEADAATTAAQQLEAATTQLAETQEAVQASADGAMATLFDRAWRSELRQALQDIYRDAKYVLTEDEYDAWRTSADTQGAAAVLADVDRTGRTFKPLLTASNYGRLMQHVAQLVASEVEKVVLRSRFNALGAFVIDADVRALVSFFSSASRWTARDKFVRLTQMALLLGLEKPADVYDVWTNRTGALVWRLSGAEVRQVLGLRVDFAPEEIQRLKL